MVLLTNHIFFCYNVFVMEIKKWAKPENVKKTVRNSLLILYVREHPKLSKAAVGRIFDISRQRVSIILKGE